MQENQHNKATTVATKPETSNNKNLKKQHKWHGQHK